MSDFRYSSPLHFYPRPPRGGRHWAAKWEVAFNIFLSTPSARRATGAHGGPSALRLISIHALREEGDQFTAANYHTCYISIHALREEGDQASRFDSGHPCKFLSTPSARRATKDAYLEAKGILISIHALREEGDYHNRADDCRAGQFLSTPSARRATEQELGMATHYFISIHALREEGDRQRRKACQGA